MKTYLVVGGGNGLGLAVARVLAARGCGVRIADCRFSEEAEALCAPDHLHTVNLAQDSVAPLAALPFDGLFITAGIGRLDFFETFPPEEIEKNVRVNELAPLQLLRACYPRLLGEADFPVALVTSIAGHLASPLYGVYAAAKGALSRFVEAINAELEHHGSSNRILEVAPGRIPGTAFHGSGAIPSEAEKQELSGLACAIVEKAFAHECLYIPRYAETYAAVLARYAADAPAFARQSLRYKCETAELNHKPQLRVGYLTGSWDLFHIGHLNILRNAKRECDKLIVGVHPDGSHKGKELFVPLEERMEILRSVRYVDEVMVCAPEDMDDWPKLHFDVLFVGSDYQGTERFLRYEMQAKPLGVAIRYLPYTQTTSSTQLREALSRKGTGTGISGNL